jgi:hypothetical protein
MSAPISATSVRRCSLAVGPVLTVALSSSGALAAINPPGAVVHRAIWAVSSPLSAKPLTSALSGEVLTARALPHRSTRARVLHMILSASPQAGMQNDPFLARLLRVAIGRKYTPAKTTPGRFKRRSRSSRERAPSSSTSRGVEPGGHFAGWVVSRSAQRISPLG